MSLGKRRQKTKNRFYALAKSAIERYGSCSIGVIYDYIRADNPKHHRWLPTKGTLTIWLRVNDDFYQLSNGEWRCTK